MAGSLWAGLTILCCKDPGNTQGHLRSVKSSVDIRKFHRRLMDGFATTLSLRLVRDTPLPGIFQEKTSASLVANVMLQENFLLK